LFTILDRVDPFQISGKALRLLKLESFRDLRVKT